MNIKFKNLNNKINQTIFLLIILAILSTLGGFQLISSNLFFFGLLAVFFLASAMHFRDIEKTLIFILLSTSSMNILKAFNRADERFIGTSPNFFSINLINIIAFFLLILGTVKIYKLFKEENSSNNMIKNHLKEVKFLLWFFLIFTIYIAINIAFALDKVLAFYEAMRLISFIIIYLYISFFGDLKKNKELYCNILGVSVIIQLALGLLQKIIGGSLGLYVLGEVANVFRLAETIYEKGMSGTLGHPSLLALYSLFTLTFIMFLKKETKVKYLFILASIANIVLCSSRTVILLTVIPLFIYFTSNRRQFFSGFTTLKNLLHSKNKKLGRTILVVVLIVFSTSIFAIGNRFLRSDFTYQIKNRLAHWDAAFELIKNRPITGYGLNNYSTASKVLYKYWIKIDDRKLTKNSYSISKDTRHEITVDFKGDAIEIHGVKFLEGGFGEVYLDGHYWGQIDFYEYITQGAKIFTIDNIPNKEHRVTIKVTNRKNISAEGTNITLDYFLIKDGEKSSIIEDTSDKLKYNPDRIINYFYIANPVHNLYLFYVVEFGIIGLIIILISIFINFKYSFRLLYIKDKFAQAVGRSFIVVLLCYVAYNLTGWAGVKHQVYLLYWIMAALSTNVLLQSSREKSINE